MLELIRVTIDTLLPVIIEPCLPVKGCSPIEGCGPTLEPCDPDTIVCGPYADCKPAI